MWLHRWFKASIGLLVISTILLGLLGPTPQVWASPSAQTFSATVEPLGGLVQHLAAGQTTWQTITKVLLLKPGDQIRTGDTGAARISIATGIKVEVYPTTLIELQNLALGEGSDASLKFTLSQVVGTTYITVDKPLKTGDAVIIATPSVAANIRGTKFYTFVGRTGNTGFIGEESNLQLQDVNGRSYNMEPNNIGYFIIHRTPIECTIEFLRTVQGFIIREAESVQGRHALRDFLLDFIVSNLNTRSTAFLFSFLGLPSSATQEEMLNTLKAYDKPVNLTNFLNDFRSFLRAYFTFVSTGPLPPLTCGNLRKDDGETAENCPTDMADITPSKGNAICETSLGESLINDPPDCLPGLPRFQCVKIIIGEVGKPGGGGGTPPPMSSIGGR